MKRKSRSLDPRSSRSNQAVDGPNETSESGGQNALVIIHDYPLDIAGAEVWLACIADIPRGWRVREVPIPGMNTDAMGFAIEQLALKNYPHRPMNLKIFANCAPRRDRSSRRRKNEGEGLLYVALRNGVEMVVVNSGRSLSWVRDQIRALHTVILKKSHSQFRSRDEFPEIVGRLVRKDYSFLGKKLDPARVIPAPLFNIVRHIDNFGNIKTGFRVGDPEVRRLLPGQRIKLTVHGKTLTATVATGNFNVDVGDRAFSPGSSGHQMRYFEIFTRGGNAAQEFGLVHVGDEIEIEPVSSYGPERGLSDSGERRPSKKQ